MGKYGKKPNKFGAKHQKTKFYGKSRNEYHNKTENGEKPTNERPPPRLSLREDQVGITEYVNKCAGFRAVIKSRYSDFHVNEIDLNDKVLVLNDLDIPKPKEEAAALVSSSATEAREQFKGIISEENWLQIEKLAASEKDSVTVEAVEININDLDKEKRTEIHALLKNLFSGKLVSTTVTKDIDTAQVRFLRVTKAKGNRSEKRAKWEFPGEYVKFLVHKENIDTTEVATQMAKHLSLMPSKVNYCGTKDKRAITTQMFGVKKRKPSDIVASVRYLRNVHIGNFSFSEEVVKLGQLRGNRFRIVLRHIDGDKELMVKALEELREFGFINYFGLQRFGNCVDVPTYEIGIAIMKADYKSACELILKPRDGDPQFLKTIRETWWKNRNSKEAASMFRSDRFIEKKLLDGLAKHGENDYATALRKLPRNLLLLYPHAFQSLIFNKIASRRIKEYGLKLIEGDLVYCTPSDENEGETLQAEILVENEDNPTDEQNENEEGNANSEKSLALVSPSRLKVRTLTANDISSNKYTIYDVVLPLPGFDMQYPDNALNEWYKEAMNEYGLTSEAFNHNIKTFNLSGAYRKLLILPSELSWEFCCYDKTDAQLIPSDWDQLKGKDCENRFPYEKFATDSTLHRALLLEVSLPAASYATMLLRELLKADTSSGNQSSVEVEAKALKNELDSLTKLESESKDLVNTQNGLESNETQTSIIDEVCVQAEKREAVDNAEAPSSKLTRTA